MALINNLVLSKDDAAAFAEAMSERQPGDRMTLTVQVTVRENLTDRATFDVDSVEPQGSAAPEVATVDPKDSTLAASVLGVMGGKKK